MGWCLLLHEYRHSIDGFKIEITSVEGDEYDIEPSPWYSLLSIGSAVDIARTLEEIETAIDNIIKNYKFKKTELITKQQQVEWYLLLRKFRVGIGTLKIETVSIEADKCSEDYMSDGYIILSIGSPSEIIKTVESIKTAIANTINNKLWSK